MKYTLAADVLHHSSQTRVRFDANNKDVYTGFISMTKQHCEAQTLEVIVRTMYFYCDLLNDKVGFVFIRACRNIFYVNMKATESSRKHEKACRYTWHDMTSTSTMTEHDEDPAHDESLSKYLLFHWMKFKPWKQLLDLSKLFMIHTPPLLLISASFRVKKQKEHMLYCFIYSLTYANDEITKRILREKAFLY